MIDIEKETLITMNDVCLMFPGRAASKRISLSTVWRWTLRGHKGVMLDSIVVGGKRYTSKQAVQRFVESLNPDKYVGDCRPSVVVADSQRDITRELDACGFQSRQKRPRGGAVGRKDKSINEQFTPLEKNDE